MPMRTVSYEVQNQQLAVEEQQQRFHREHHQQQQQQQLGHGAPSPAPMRHSGPVRSLFAPPLSSTTAVAGPPAAAPGLEHSASQRSPERASAPAAMYAGAGAPDDDDDDRPLGLGPHAPQQQQQRESFPPHTRAAAAQPATARPGFEVTSRRVSGGSTSGSSSDHAHDPALLSSSTGAGAGASAESKHERRASAMSDRSFDASEIYDAYAPGSPGLVSPAGLGSSPLFGGGGGAAAGAKEPPTPAIETPPGAVLGAVTPRGSSLRALSR